MNLPSTDKETAVQILQRVTAPTQTGVITPRLLLSRGAIDMISTYVNAQANTEINGFAYVRRLNAGTFFVGSADDVFITLQTVTQGSAEATGVGYALAVDRAAQDDRVNELRLQWHSHPADAYFSPTDMANIENYGHAGAEWFISVVTNRDGDFHARFDMFRPVRIGGNMTVSTYTEVDPDMQMRAERDIAEMVTVITPRVQKPGRRGGIVLKSGN